MRQYKLSVHDRNYNEWSVYDASTHEEVDKPDIDPVTSRLLNGDIFTFSNDTVEIIHSVVRSSVQIPGVLMIDSNMYGKIKNKYVYKCIPDDKHLPIFLIPYEEKQIGFIKRKINRYITFQFKDWNSTHPEAFIKNNIGDVEEINNFYEYQLFCKSLNSSIQGFGKDAKRSMNRIDTKSTMEEIIDTHSIERRKDVYIFTIDGNGTQDFDDAFSITEHDDDSATLSIYITNVAIWVDVLNLWSSFSERISSIYLPDRKRPMLPTVLTNILCSLYKDQQRIAVSMDITFNKDAITHIEFKNVAITVNENYFYNAVDESNLHYKKLKKYCGFIFKEHKLMKHIHNSKDVVAYLMLFMNYQTSKVFVKHNKGIYRSLSNSESYVPDNISPSLFKFIKIWNSSSGQYTLTNKDHDMLEIESYVHITSPMRRLIDMLNIINIQQILNLYTFTSMANEFYESWTQKLDYVNKTTRSIRKIQSDCNLLHWCSNHTNLHELKFDGYVFDKMERSDGLFQYVVFVGEINMASRVTIHKDLENYSQHKFSVHIFNKKESFKKKVRLHLVEEN